MKTDDKPRCKHGISKHPSIAFAGPVYQCKCCKNYHMHINWPKPEYCDFCGDKPRLVRVTDPVEIEALNDGRAKIHTPYGYYKFDGIWYADAAELAKWRAGRGNEV